MLTLSLFIEKSSGRPKFLYIRCSEGDPNEPTLKHLVEEGQFFIVRTRRNEITIKSNLLLFVIYKNWSESRVGGRTRRTLPQYLWCSSKVAVYLLLHGPCLVLWPLSRHVRIPRVVIVPVDSFPSAQCSSPCLGSPFPVSSYLSQVFSLASLLACSSNVSSTQASMLGYALAQSLFDPLPWPPSPPTWNTNLEISIFCPSIVVCYNQDPCILPPPGQLINISFQLN